MGDIGIETYTTVLCLIFFVGQEFLRWEASETFTGVPYLIPQYDAVENTWKYKVDCDDVFVVGQVVSMTWQ